MLFLSKKKLIYKSGIILLDFIAYFVICLFSSLLFKGNIAYNPSRINIGSIAIYNSDEPCVVSPMYSVFKVINTDKVLPEYLMLWFGRTEFQRYTFNISDQYFPFCSSILTLILPQWYTYSFLMFFNIFLHRFCLKNINRFNQ